MRALFSGAVLMMVLVDVGGGGLIQSNVIKRLDVVIYFSDIGVKNSLSISI